MTLNRPRLPQDNVKEHDCTCLICLGRAVKRPSVFVPADEGKPARWLHGDELEAWWVARDAVRARMQKLTGRDVLGEGR